MSITKSASKLVLLLIVAVLGILTLFAGIWDIIHGTFSEVTKIILGLFGSALSFVMGFYFGYKGEQGQLPPPALTPEEVEARKVLGMVDTPPFAGK